MTNFQIPIPPLEVQKEIVAEIEGYQKVIDGARAVVDNYRPQIAVDPAWPLAELGEVCELIMDGTHFSPNGTQTKARDFILLPRMSERTALTFPTPIMCPKQTIHRFMRDVLVKKGDVLYVKDGAGTRGLAAINTLDEEFSLL